VTVTRSGDGRPALQVLEGGVSNSRLSDTSVAFAGSGFDDRYAVGVHHVAFEAMSRDAVDQWREWVLSQDVDTESAPKEFPHYVDGYYAAFFYDPDG
jgi:catechol 2,3-dioxygenase-like lactoylglutathione lyase family enzyme